MTYVIREERNCISKLPWIAASEGDVNKDSTWPYMEKNLTKLAKHAYDAVQVVFLST